MTPLKVAHVGNDANVAYFYSHLLRKLGVESTIYQTRTPLNFETQIMNYGYDSGNPLNINLKYLEGKNLVNRVLDLVKIGSEYDVIHLHGGGGLVGSTSTKFTPAKRIGHFHGSDIRRFGPTSQKKRFRLWFFKKIINFDKILVSTPDLIKEVWTGANAEVLLNPLDPVIENIERSKGDYIFLPTRHDNFVKGTDRFFRAWRTIRERLPHIKLVTIRWGVDCPRLEENTKDDNRIIWINPLTRTEYIEYLRGSQLVIGQFILDIYSLIELEAIYSGIPLISLHSSKINSPEEIANEAIRLLGNDAHRLMVIKNLKREIEKIYNPDKLSRQLYSIYLELLER